MRARTLSSQVLTTLQRSWRCAVGCALALLAPSVARAQDTSGLLEVLDENVVSGASKSAESSSDAPAMSTNITADQLRRFGIHRLDEALNFLSLGMFAQDNLSVPEVGARGVLITR